MSGKEVKNKKKGLMLDINSDKELKGSDET